MKFDEDYESASNFDPSWIVEELLTDFRSTFGKIEFSNFLKVKSELCSPHSFHQFQLRLSKLEVIFLNLFVFKVS